MRIQIDDFCLAAWNESNQALKRMEINLSETAETNQDWTPLTEDQSDHIQELLFLLNPSISSQAFRVCMQALHAAANYMSNGQYTSVFQYSDQKERNIQEIITLIEHAQRILLKKEFIVANFSRSSQISNSR